jgi:hypothetical protein
VHRIAIEIPITTVAAAMIASFVLIAGIAIEPPAAPIMVPGAPVEPLFDGWGNCLIATVTALSASDVLGHARLCQVGDDVQATFRVGGLVPGAVYTGLLSYTMHPVLCTHSYCEPPTMLSDAQDVLMQQFDEGIAASSRTLELDATLPDFSPVSGAQVTLLLQHSNGGVESHAEAIFSIP